MGMFRECELKSSKIRSWPLNFSDVTLIRRRGGRGFPDCKEKSPSGRVSHF